MPDTKEIEQYFKELNFDIKDLRNLKLLLQQNNDLLESGLRSNNITNFRNLCVFNAQDSLDATYPMYLHFNIIEEMTKIVSIKLSFWLLPFRAYSTAAASGGGQTSSTTTTPSGGGSTSGSGGGQTSSSSNIEDAMLFQVGLETVSGVSNILRSKSGPYAAIGDPDGLKDHTHTVSNHTHTTPNHTHPSHSHTVSNHTHNINFGIHEEDNSPTIGFQISRDNGKTYGNILGRYTTDIENLEIKDYINKSGSYIIKFTSSARARLSVQITIKLDINAR